MRSKKKRMQSLTTSLQNSRASVLSTDERVCTLQRKLYLKAKQDKAFKFYVLYDKVRLDYFLWEAYRRVRANGGAPGVDRIDFEQIEKAGLPEFIEGIRKDLLNKTYKAQAVRRVYIPKANGKLRPWAFPRSGTGWCRCAGKPQARLEEGGQGPRSLSLLYVSAGKSY
jgi:RNA-directed DNA polymerase